MTSTSSVISVCNRALGSIGARSTIASLTESSTEAQQCNVFYQSTFEQLARTARWGCLRKEQSLGLLAAAQGTPENPDGTTTRIPPLPWLYAYSLPSDCLFMRGILPNIPATGTGTNQTTASLISPTIIPNNGMYPFKIAYWTDDNNNPIEIVLCNMTQANGIYTVNNSSPSNWDSLFEQAFVASLAAYLVPALNLNFPLMGACIKQAETAIAMARAADGNETPVSQDHMPDWIVARQGGSLSGFGYNYYNQLSNYPGMIWPSGYTSGAGIA